MASKVALVTASSAGLGAATARRLAVAGYHTVINYHSSREKADELVREIVAQNHAARSTDPTVDAAPVRCVAIQADMSQRPDITRLVHETVSTFGRLDVVVSNQGWTRMRRFHDLADNADEDDWDRCYNLNVKAHFYLFYAAEAYLRETRGAFVSVASLAGVVPSGSSIPYAVTKAAQLHMIKALAAISGPHIRVNSVSPGILLTDWGKKFPAERLEAARTKSVLHSLAEIEDVVDQILLFAQSRSSTGCNAVIDAGWLLG